MKNVEIASENQGLRIEDRRSKGQASSHFSDLLLSIFNPRFLLLAVAVLIAGCASPGDLVIHQAADAPMRMSKVDVAGDYGLFRPGDQQPLLDFPLKEGDRIGFEKVNDGVVIWLYAVAGDSRNRLEVDKTYEWRRL